MCLCTIRGPGAYEGQKRVSDLLELTWVELIEQLDLSDVGSEN